MKHLLLAAVAAATIAAPVHAQADRCSQFRWLDDQDRCRVEFTYYPPADPYCLPMTAQQMRAVRAGRQVMVPGIGGCSQVWN